MSISVVYDAHVAFLPGGGNGVMLTRGMETRTVCGFRKTASLLTVLLTAEDALEMVETYRQNESGVFRGADGVGELYIDMVDHESFTLYWTKEGKRVEDSLWSDWPEAFMAEVEIAAREARE